MSYVGYIEYFGRLVDVAGVFVILVGILYAIVEYLQKWFKDNHEAYKILRKHIGRSILLGLEFIIAGDIIRSIVVPLTIPSVATLALLLLIRTFLAFQIEIEAEGKLPWQKK